jgi:hypothetical protein
LFVLFVCVFLVDAYLVDPQVLSDQGGVRRQEKGAEVVAYGKGPAVQAYAARIFRFAPSVRDRNELGTGVAEIEVSEGAKDDSVLDSVDAKKTDMVSGGAERVVGMESDHFGK